MTAKSLRRHSGSGLSGRPPSEPFRCLKRATRCIISSRLQFRISFQSLMAFPPGAIIVPRRRKHADTAARRQPDRLPGWLQLASLGGTGEGLLREEQARSKGDADAKVDGPDLIAFMGGDNGFLRLVAVPEVKTLADLRSKTVSVDARTTGYAFV